MLDKWGLRKLLLGLCFVVPTALYIAVNFSFDDGGNLRTTTEPPAVSFVPTTKPSTPTESTVDLCQSGRIYRPENGDIFKHSFGNHQLAVDNTKNRNDAIAKLKNLQGKTVTSFYVRAGESVTVDGIPDGVYQFMYATGDQCCDDTGRFLQDMQANKDIEIESFEEGSRRILTYTLHSIIGNVHEERIPNEEF